MIIINHEIKQGHVGLEVEWAELGKDDMLTGPTADASALTCSRRYMVLCRESSMKKVMTNTIRTIRLANF